MLASQIKTASDLRAFVEMNNEESHFFSRDSMKFSGDTMRNYGVRKVTIRTMYGADGNYVPEGTHTEAWELYRRHAVKHGLKDSAFFRADNFARTFRVAESI